MNNTAIITKKIIEIDEDKCDGCGLCVSACHEGAIQLVDGKAKLVREDYCDGLGDCIGECPLGAINIIEKEYDIENKKDNHISNQTSTPKNVSSCPGMAVRHITNETKNNNDISKNEPTPSMLQNWPIQLTLVPPNAPYFQDADLLISSDCAPYAYPDFHNNLLRDKILINACPKLDNKEFYLEKLKTIFKINNINSIEIAYMEVPCCSALINLVNTAINLSDKDIPVSITQIGINGKILKQSRLNTNI